MPTGQRKIRVAQVITGLVLGGGGQVIWTIARNIDRSRFDVDVYCIIGGGELQPEIERLGTPVQIIPGHAGRGIFPYRPARVLELARALRRGRYDIVHTHLFQADVIGRIAARLAGIPAVIKSLHNMGAWKKPHHLLADRLLARNTARVICCSDWQRESAIRQEHLHPDRVLTIYHGVDHQRFRASVQRAEYLLTLGLNPAKRVVGTVGRPIPEKGQQFLIEAIPDVIRAHPDAQFLIVGEGPLRQALKDRVRTLGLEAVVRMPGARPDIPELLSVMDVFVFPSLSEGLGISLLEAMAARVPVVASNIRPLSEIVVHRLNGLLVEPRNSRALAGAINELLSDAGLAGRVRDRALLDVRHRFSEEHMVRALERVYAEVHREVHRAPTTMSRATLSSASRRRP